MESYNPAKDENQGVASTFARNSEDLGEEREPELSSSGTLPDPDPDPMQSTLYREPENDTETELD
ncbi:hypothetical protein ACO2Q8_07660 [Larkinella sp. VNQ87]|uniref:hypothetical protein n=1 Tax=Larkinella sp. VNQ87 TaxID=3400921 RepID=UPI003C0CB0C5